MKKFVLAAVAASLLATPAMAAPQRGDHGPARTERTTVVHKQVTRTPQRGYAQAQQNRNWQRGERFDSRYARNYRQVDYRTHGRLYAPPRGYQWVQSGNDAVLVALASGLIGAVLGGALAN
ncbi:RcnB family protein [Sphingomonas sp. PL-96]|uniref:RcnB family protein n=1 Tax=Sphingomonas sp. PL-96 TaxID=2887201 RepID=UPI001E290645|nr:RcnB family protein [Sphingomonas sp. PL-96]MCC2975963.1 RcnB family protein [Sphingomonas sp. PL-96]